MDRNTNDIEAGYVGIEYVIKYVSKRTNEMVYECLMCSLILPTQGMQSHVLGYTHRSKYLNQHFPTLSGDIRNYVVEGIPNFSRVMNLIFDDICAAIERYHGRQIPKQFDESIVERERNKITNEVFSLRHASEANGPIFIERINKIIVDGYIREAQNSLPETFSSNANRPPVFDSGSKYKLPSLEKETHRPRYDRFLENDREDPRSNRGTDRSRFRDKSRDKDMSRDRDRSRDYRHSRDKNDSYRYRERSRSRDRNRSTSKPRNKYNSNRVVPKNPINLHLYSDPPLSDDVHKKLVEEFLQQTVDKRSSVEDDLKKKTSAPIEEDLREKLDRNRRAESPYRPDDIWQIYRRMFDQAVTSLNDEYKNYRNYPESHPEYNSEWKAFWCKRKEELTNNGIDYRNHDFQAEWVDFFKNRIEGLFEEHIEKMKINLRKQLDLPIDNKKVLAAKYMLKEPVQERVSCLSVLRILTALENDLGSLGPKAVDLMAKALTLEKISAGGSDKLLNDDNCTFFETVNEKLKGLILVLGLEGKNYVYVIYYLTIWIFIGSKLKTVTNVISNIETLIAQTAQQRQPPIESSSGQSQSDIDFKKLSAGLAAKGKNVDSEKIKEIISLYNLLAHKTDSVEKNKSLSATLVDFLSTGGPKDSKQINITNQVSSTSEMSLAEATESCFDRFSGLK